MNAAARESTTDDKKAQGDSEEDASQKDSADDCDADGSQPVASRDVYSDSSEKTNGKDSDKANHGSCSEGTEGNDSGRNMEGRLHIIQDENHDYESNTGGKKLSLDTPKPRSLVAFGRQGNSNNTVPGEDLSTSAKDTSVGTIADTSCKIRVTEQPRKGKQGSSAQDMNETESANDADKTAGAVSGESGNMAHANTAAVTDGKNLPRLKMILQRTCETPVLVEKGVPARGENHQSVSAKDIDQMDQADHAKITPEVVGEESPEQAAVQPALKTCSGIVKQDGKVILPPNLFPKTLKELKTNSAHRKLFSKFSFVFPSSSRQESLDEATEETPQIIKAWKDLRYFGRRAFENCIVANFRNDKIWHISQGEKKEPSCMNDVTRILRGLTKSEQFQHDPFLFVITTCKLIHSIPNEHWVSAYKDILAKQPVPFSFDEVPDPAKKTTKHSIHAIGHLGKCNVIKEVQKLEWTLTRMTVRSRRKCYEVDNRKTDDWKTIQLSELDLPHDMGKNGVLAIEPHMFDSWRQKLALNDGAGINELAKQSEAPRLVFQLAKVAVSSGWSLEKVMNLLTGACVEQQRLLGVSATIPNSAVVDNPPFNPSPNSSNPPSGSEDKHHTPKVAICSETQNQGNLLNNSTRLSDSPKGNTSEIHQYQAAERLAADTQVNDTQKNGRQIHHPSVPHNFFPQSVMRDNDNAAKEENDCFSTFSNFGDEVESLLQDDMLDDSTLQMDPMVTVSLIRKFLSVTCLHFAAQIIDSRVRLFLLTHQGEDRSSEKETGPTPTTTAKVTTAKVTR